MHQGYVTFQFEIKNLLPNVVIKNVGVVLTINDPVLQFVNEVKAPSISHKEIGYSYVILTYDAESKTFPVSTFQAKMLFTIVEFDPSTNVEEGSYEEEYILPDLTLSAKDYVTGKTLNETEFK